MNDRHPVDAALAQLVPPFDEDPGAWDDVLLRARAPVTRARTIASPPRRRERRPRIPRWRVRMAAGLVAVAALIATAPGRAGAEWVGTTLGLVEIGSPPTDHRSLGDATAPESFVIATGHAPDGAPYELVVDRYRGGAEVADGEPVSSCITLDWPGVGPGPSGFCGPGFPPPQGGGRAPAGAAARPFGYLSPYPGTTRYLALLGFAQPDVARVEVSYPASAGSRRAAAAHVTELSRQLLERIGSVRAVNVFVAFVPWSAGADARHSSKTLEVVAYDRAGRELGRVRHENLMNPSLSGPAPPIRDH